MGGNLLELLWATTKIGVLAFGGGNSAIPLLESEAVPRWLSQPEFAELVGINFAFPGVSVLKVAGMVGFRVAGLAGLVTAIVGMAAPGLLLTAGAYGALRRYHDHWFVQRSLVALQFAAAALLAGSSLNIWKSAAAARVPLGGVVIAVGVFCTVYLFKLSPVIAILLAVAAGSLLLV